MFRKTKVLYFLEIQMTMVEIKNRESVATDFMPVLRSGFWSDIGGRENMEDAHVCIADLAKTYGQSSFGR